MSVNLVLPPTLLVQLLSKQLLPPLPPFPMQQLSERYGGVLAPPRVRCGGRRLCSRHCPVVCPRGSDAARRVLCVCSVFVLGAWSNQSLSLLLLQDPELAKYQQYLDILRAHYGIQLPGSMQVYCSHTRGLSITDSSN